MSYKFALGKLFRKKVNYTTVYPISSLDGTISLIETKLCPNYVLKSGFLVCLNHFLRDLFSQAEEFSQARAVP